MGDDPGSLTFPLVIIFALILINAFLSAAEMAMISANKEKLRDMSEDGDRRAKRVLTLIREPRRFMQIIHVGITLTSFFNVAIASKTLAPRLAEILHHYLTLPFAEEISFIVIVALFSYLCLLFGELVPKRIVLQHPERFAFSGAGLIRLLANILKPFSLMLTASSNFFLRIFGIDVSQTEDKVTREEIRSIIEVGHAQGVINPAEREMIDAVIAFDDQQAEEIMTARTEVFMIDIDDPLEDYLSEMLNLKYSRIPVYEDNPDNIIGILYLKDFLHQAYKKGSFKDIKIRGILRPAFFVPERKNINDLFNEMQEGRKHMAVLIDEYGGFSGLVTMEDLIEEIVGDIDDEYDHDEPDISQIDEHTYRIKGSISIKEFNSETGADIDEDSEDFDTIGGFLINVLDYIPEDGECPVVEYEHLIFHILNVQEKRIKDIRVEVLPLDEELSDEE